MSSNRYVITRPVRAENLRQGMEIVVDNGQGHRLLKVWTNRQVAHLINRRFIEFSDGARYEVSGSGQYDVVVPGARVIELES